MSSGSYFFDDGNSREFWSYSLEGSKQSIRRGRIGTAGQETVQSFPSPAAAKGATAELVSQKLEQGYVQVDSNKLNFHRKKAGQGPATKAQVASLEKRLNAKLPPEYKAFLLSQNGGLPEQNWIAIPGDTKGRRLPLGEIYGLYDEPQGYSVLWGLDKVQPRLPAGHLPISGWNTFCSISLQQDPGCIYLWDQYTGPRPEKDSQREPIFTAANGVLLAGSFDEFLTRLAIYKEPTAPADPMPASASASEKTPVKETKPAPQSDAASSEKLTLAEKAKLSKKRQAEIERLTYEGGEELSAAYEVSEQAGDKFRRQIHREIMEFLKTTTNKHELQFFADNWHWDSGHKPLLAIAKHPHVDAGTLAQIFWHSSAEDYYLFHRTAAEIDEAFERGVFQVLVQIERRFVKGDIKTASLPFDPTDHISMLEQRSQFARPIPEIMYQPILGRKQRER